MRFFAFIALDTIFFRIFFFMSFRQTWNQRNTIQFTPIYFITWNFYYINKFRTYCAWNVAEIVNGSSANDIFTHF